MIKKPRRKPMPSARLSWLPVWSEAPAASTARGSARTGLRQRRGATKTVFG